MTANLDMVIFSTTLGFLKNSQEGRSGWPLNRLLHSQRLNLFSLSSHSPSSDRFSAKELIYWGAISHECQELACCKKEKKGDSPEACSISLLLSLKQGNSCHDKNFMFETIKSIIYKAVNCD